MQFTFATTPTTTTLVRPLVQDDFLTKNLQEIAAETGLSPETLTNDFKAECNEILPLYLAGGRKLYLIGLGKEPKSAQVLKAFRTLFHQQKPKLPAAVSLDLRGCPVEWVEWAVNGTLLGGYNLALYKTDEAPKSPFFSENGLLELVVDAAQPVKVLNTKLETGRAVAETQLRIFDLMNAPANHKTPQTLVSWALGSGEQYGYDVRALDVGEIQEAGLEALLAVSRGSLHEPALIILDYHPAGATQTVGLVGKGVTFDTGGVSIKPSTNMHLMKSDMGGAAAVLGTVELAAKLKLPVRVVGIVPTTENSVDGDAMKPGDVIGSYSGKTIEVTDTDAEGRLILADGLAYCLKNYQPDVLIDLATLTGNVIAALGYHAAGLFTTNNDLGKTLKRAGETTGERLWRLPLWDEYAEHLKSDIADVRNYSGIPHSGAIAAGKFLELFTEKHPAWAHLDIAGVAFGDTDFAPQRAGTAFGVRLLVEWLRNL
ncbi:MAG: leucyl aminopeptidase [Cytophagaceae bacterium]|nr:leucyl aminopeptidase [Cytophagaceae bacterium]